VHGGTGTHVATIWVVDSASVPGSSSLAFSGLDVEVTTMLFAIADAVVPNWFGVALPRGISDFTRPHLFFHPTPAQAGCVDGDYQSKGGKWPELFYYMERLGYQLDGGRRNQALVIPFMTEGAEGRRHPRHRLAGHPYPDPDPGANDLRPRRQQPADDQPAGGVQLQRRDDLFPQLPLHCGGRR
jgi:hypothetical protein